MSARLTWLARVLLRCVPEQYRADVSADLMHEHRGGSQWALYRAILASAVDARRVARHRETRGPWWSGVANDLAQALRHARHRPGLTISAGLTVAFAVGINTAVFTVTRSVLLRPLPFHDEARVGFVWSLGNSGALEPLSPGRALDFSRSTAFDAAALIGHIAMPVTGLGDAERWSGASVSAPFFDVLGTPPLLGRTFTATDRGSDLVVLSHVWWRTRFGGDPSVVGRTIVLGGRSRQIIGVMGPDFYWPTTTPNPTAAFPPVFWSLAPAHDVPERPGGFEGDPTQDRGTVYVRLVARLRPDLHLTSASSLLSADAQALGAQHPTTDGNRGVVFRQARTQMLGAASRPLWLLTAATWLVLCGAGVNVAGLFLVNLAARQREFAVRAALGAGRWRLARQFCAESLAIAGAGGIVGVGLAIVALPAFAAWLPASLARRDTIALDGAVIASAALVTLCVAVLAASAPIVSLWRRQRTETLRAGGTVGARLSGRGLLVGAEAAVAVVVITLTMLMTESLIRLKAVEVGFNTEQLLTFNVSLTGAQAQDARARVAVFEEILGGVSAIPGVTSAAGAATLPIGGDDFGSRAFPEGKPLPPPGQEARVGYQIVTPQWFKTLGVPIVAGRDLDLADTLDREPVVLVNESLARALWPGEQAVGQRMTTRRGGTRWLRVVGVVRDIHHLGPGQPPRPEFYRPLAQESFSFLAVAVRTQGDPSALIAPVRRAVTAVDASLPIADVAVMADHLRADYADATTLSALTMMFGAVALVLAAIGVYGAVAFSVASRTAEFGLRAALGATPVSMAGMVIRQAMTPVGIGAVAGAGIAWMLSESVRAQLFEVSPHAPAAYVGAIFTIVLTAVCAAWWPARRAARVDPLAALRSTQ